MGGKRRGVPVKTLKKILKKAGLKTTGKKAALTRRAKQAKLVKKGGDMTKIDTAAIDDMNKKVEAAETDAKEAQVKADQAADEVKAMSGGRKRKSRSRGMRFF
jgi:transcription antitermination factor NusG